MSRNNHLINQNTSKKGQLQHQTGHHRILTGFIKFWFFFQLIRNVCFLCSVQLLYKYMYIFFIFVHFCTTFLWLIVEQIINYFMPSILPTRQYTLHQSSPIPGLKHCGHVFKIWQTSFLHENPLHGCIRVQSAAHSPTLAPGSATCMSVTLQLDDNNLYFSSILTPSSKETIDDIISITANNRIILLWQTDTMIIW